MWLCLDLSSRTGWALWDGQDLKQFGLIEEIIPNFKQNVRNFKDLPKEYPSNYVDAIDRLMSKIAEVFEKHPVTMIVVEHTEGSSFRFSQKYLEWLHLVFWQKFSKKCKIIYLLNKDWRQATDCYLRCWPEFIEHNKLHAKLKKKLKSKVVKHEGKRIGRKDHKKLSIHIANILLTRLNKELISDDNIADAINLGQAALVLIPEINKKEKKPSVRKRRA